MSEAAPETVSERAAVVRADNPGIMTLDGTNTWILREPGAARSIVVDPGPADADHLRAVAEHAGPVGLVLFTHRHADHTEAIDEFAELTGAPARATDPEFCRDGLPLADGEVIDVDGLRLEVVATPGHTSDSTCFRLVDEPTLLSGDSVLGRGTTVVAHPDGQLGAYLGSLRRLHALAEAQEIASVWPGHGPVIGEALPALDHYLAHRQQRLEQVEAALARLDDVPAEELPRRVVEMVYADVDQTLWGAAELSVRAQVAYLQDRHL